jgi:Zn-dependent peptidase ImmA (M78 family)
MLEQHTQRDIEKISSEILKGSKSLDVFPTPVNKIVSYAELIIDTGIDLSKIHPDYMTKATEVLKKALGKLQGVLDRREKIIMLDLSQGKSKQNFVKLHEVGHGVLPWQQKSYDVLEDDDDSLGNHVCEEFEAEANFFASVTLFQGDRFIFEMDKLGLGIESSMQLSKLFGSSIHAALRRYVEYSKNR